MMKKTLSFVVLRGYKTALFVCLSVLLVSCGGGNGNVANALVGTTPSSTSVTSSPGVAVPVSPQQPIPTTTPSSSGSTVTTNAQDVTLSYTLKPGVRIFSPAEAATVSDIVTNGTEMLLTADSPVTQGLIFIANGAAFKATSVTTTNGQRRASIAVPGLAEVFQNFKVNGSLNVASLSTSSSVAPINPLVMKKINAAAPNLSQSLHYDVPVNTSISSGTLGVDITGTLFFDIFFNDQGVFEKTITKFTGDVAVEGEITLKKSTEPVPLFPAITYNPSCVNFLLVDIPSDICFPVTVGVNLSTEYSASTVIRYTQKYVGNVVYPQASNIFTSDLSANDASSFSSTADIKLLPPCTTQTAKIAPNITFEPRLNLLKTFTIVELPASLTVDRTVKIRTDFAKISQSLASESNLTAELNAKIGISTPMLDKVSYNGSLLDYGVQKAGQFFVNKVIGGINKFTFFETQLIKKEIPLVTPVPLPVCLNFLPKSVTTSGQRIDVVIDPNTIDPNTKQTIVVKSPINQILPTAAGSANSFDAPQAGTYIATVTQISSTGQKTEQTVSYSLIPSGTFVGSFSGGDSGPATVTITPEGALTGSATSSRFGSNITGTGTVSNVGSFSFGGQTNGGATFTGVYTPSSTGWTLTGTWQNSRSGLSGVFTLLKL